MHNHANLSLNQNAAILLRHLLNGSEEKSAEHLESIKGDWPILINEIEVQGIAPFLWWALSKSDSLSRKVPPEALDRLRLRYYESAVHNLELQKRLEEISAYFLREKIDAILLKGLHIACNFYENIALRPIYDIDLLIKKSDLGAVMQILESLGYRSNDRYREDFYNGDIMVDLHLDLVSTQRIPSRALATMSDVRKLWQDSKKAKIGNFEMRVPSSEDLLIYLPVHLVLHHGLDHLIFFVDIDMILKREGAALDWGKFIQRVCDFGAIYPVYYTFLCAKEQLGMEIPQEILNLLEPKKEGVLQKVLLKALEEKGRFSDARYLLTLLMMPGFYKKIKFLRESILPSRKVAFEVYGGKGPIKGYYFHLKRLRDVARNTLRLFFQ